MLGFNEKVYDLNSYKSKFTEEEKQRLIQCFEQIQKYIKDNYMSKNSRNIVEFQLHYNMYTHSYLVIDFVRNEVYLSHRDHGCSKENYFCTNEDTYKGWKYTMCLIVVEKWTEIKKSLDTHFNNIKNISELCDAFSI